MLSIDRRTALLQMGAVAGAAFLTETVRAEGAPIEQAPAAPAAAPPTGPFTLPALSYAYDALEPYFDAETMHLHHDKHHQAYVNNLNAAVAAHPELAGKSVEDLLKSLGTIPPAALNAVRNNGGGHFNHSFWWLTLGKGGAAPTGELAESDRSQVGLAVRFSGQTDRCGLKCVWQWLGVAGEVAGWIGCDPDDSKPGRDNQRGAEPGARRGCVGARLLSEVPE